MLGLSYYCGFKSFLSAVGECGWGSYLVNFVFFAIICFFVSKDHRSSACSLWVIVPDWFGIIHGFFFLLHIDLNIIILPRALGISKDNITLIVIRIKTLNIVLITLGTIGPIEDIFLSSLPPEGPLRFNANRIIDFLWGGQLCMAFGEFACRNILHYILFLLWWYETRLNQRSFDYYLVDFFDGPEKRPKAPVFFCKTFCFYFMRW